MRDPVVAQLTQGITPVKIALTVAIGSALALFPILGTTTILCLLAGIFLRLNQPIIQAVNYLCTPIHLVFIPFALRWGEWLFGVAHTRFEFRGLLRAFHGHPLDFLHNFWFSAFHAIVAWAIFAPFWIATIYCSALSIPREIVRIRTETAAKTMAETPPNHPIP